MFNDLWGVDDMLLSGSERVGVMTFFGEAAGEAFRGVIGGVTVDVSDTLIGIL